MWKWRHTSLTEASNESQNPNISFTCLDKNQNNNLCEIYEKKHRSDQNKNVKLVLSNFNCKR